MNSARAPPPAARATAPVADDYFDEPFYTPPEPEFNLNEDVYGNVELSDEAYARRVEQDIMAEEAAQRQAQSKQRTSTRSLNATTSSQSHVIPSSHSRSNMNHSGSNMNYNGGRAPAPRSNNSGRTSQADAVVLTGMVLSDEELARRMDQELRDEDLARQCVADQQIRQSSISARAMAANTDRSNSKKFGCCCALRKCFSCCSMLLLIVVAVGVLLFFFSAGGEVGDFIPDPDRFRAEDPFNNANTADANLWRTKGDGLELTLINALDQEWYEYFYKAVDQWDSGSPDTLTLKTETADPESVCRPVNGKLKVCNGDYGETSWRGINKVLLENGWIYSSAARMNDFYVAPGKDIAQRQYTMCHEIGHGFGLPHTDENFFNKDLNNCMDYTSNPENNMQPDTPNFLFLAELYGTVDGSTIPPTGTDTVRTNAAVPENEADQKNGSGKNKGGKERDLAVVENDSLPPAVAAALEDIDLLIENGLVGSERDGWRKMNETPNGHSHEIDLGDGYTIQIHILT